MAKRDLTQEEINNLAAVYLAARERLLNTIIGYEGVGTKTYANAILRQLQRELAGLQKQSNEFIETAIPREYRKGLRDTYAYFTRNHLRMKDPSAFASLHTDALYEISREMQFSINDGLAQVGRQVTRYVEIAQDEALRRAGLLQTGIKSASGGTVQDMKNALEAELKTGGFMTVQYGQGEKARKVPIDVYSSMVARSTSREAGNTARLNQLAENGYDLVKMSKHYPTCEVCAQHQDRVYSISGTNKRFPPLSKAFGKYNNIHPNCRHVVTPWIESLMTPEEVDEAARFSNRPFEDSRSSKEVATYNNQQNQNREARNTIYQYERYKERLGEDAPKTWMAFARMKKAGGEGWGVLQAKYKGMGYYEKAVKNEPEITKTILDTAKEIGMDTAGLEYRIKGRKRFLEKIEAKYDSSGNEYEVKDILRYTYTSHADSLTEKTIESIEKLREKGYNTVGIKNFWMNPDDPYNGVNTVVRTARGQAFELQYHTPDSFAMKDGELHRIFEKWRVLPSGGEKDRLREEMLKLTEGSRVPSGIEKVH